MNAVDTLLNLGAAPAKVDKKASNSSAGQKKDSSKTNEDFGQVLNKNLNTKKDKPETKSTKKDNASEQKVIKEEEPKVKEDLSVEEFTNPVVNFVSVNPVTNLGDIAGNSVKEIAVKLADNGSKIQNIGLTALMTSDLKQNLTDVPAKNDFELQLANPEGEVAVIEPEVELPASNLVNAKNASKAEFLPEELLQNTRGQKPVEEVKVDKSIAEELLSTVRDDEKSEFVPLKKETAFAGDGKSTQQEGQEGLDFNFTQTNQVKNELNVNQSAPKVQFYSLADQIVKESKLLVGKEKSELHIQLKPEYLGKLNMKIALTDGIITARLVVENIAVAKALESNLHQLKNTLQEQGVKVDQIQLEVGQGDLAQSFNRESNQGSQSFKQGRSGTEMDYDFGFLETEETTVKDDSNINFLA